MRIVASKTRITSIITSTLVLAALAIIATFQYKWLISSTERDLSELYRGINFRIYRSLSYEIENEFLAFKEIISLKNPEIEIIKRTLEDVFGEYIDVIGFITEEGAYIYNGSVWEIGKASIDFNRSFGYFIPDPANPGFVKFIFPINRVEKISGFIYFDLLKFYNDRINESNTLFGEDYTLDWYFSLPTGSNVINEKEYIYSPVRVIKNRLLKKDKNWLFGVTFYLEMFRDKRGDSPKLHIKPIGRSALENDYSLYLDIKYKGKSLIASKENYITLLWVLTFTLLLGVGIAYIFILNQIRRLKELRAKEKVFVASVSHELRTPLTVIHSAADNIQNGIITQERMSQYGDLIKNQSSRLSSMVEGILLFSRLEGKSEKSPVLREIIINEFIKDLDIVKDSVIKDFGAKVYLDFNLNHNFISDRDSLILILSNLLINAGKHGSKVIRVRIHIKVPKKLIFIVEDDGEGIEKREIKHIFEPFYRCEKSYLKQTKGSGLGLFLSSRKAKLLGGDLRVESPYERIDEKKRSGARFILTVPYVPGASGGEYE